MATVTGITAERAKEIEDSTITGARLVDGSLLLTTRGGTSINVGRVTPLPIDSWPIGAIYTTTDWRNPRDILGGGSWQRWAKGRVIMGVDENALYYDRVEKEGGSQTHKLTIENMPPHSHGGWTGIENQAHTHTGTTTADGAHTHAYETPTDTYQGTGNGAVSAFRGYRSAIASGAAGHHSHNVATNGPSQSHQHPIPVEGAAAPINIIQPYITAYIWKRMG